MIPTQGSEIFDEVAVTALIKDRIAQQGVFPSFANREKIIEQNSPHFCSQEKTGDGEAEDEQDIPGHLQKRVPAGINPVQTVGVLVGVVGVRIEQDIGSRKEAVHDVLMCNSSFSNWLQMKWTDLIAVDLGQDLPVSCAEVSPLCLGTLWTVTEAAGGNTAIRIQ